MKLPAGIIRTFKDIQLNLDALAKGAASFADLKSHAFSMGTAALVYSANNDATATVPHRLGATPSHVDISPTVAGTQSIAQPAWSADQTDLTITARTFDGTNQSMTVNVTWLAVA